MSTLPHSSIPDILSTLIKSVIFGDEKEEEHSETSVNSSDQNIFFDEAVHPSQSIAEQPYKQDVRKLAASEFVGPYLPDQKSNVNFLEQNIFLDEAVHPSQSIAGLPHKQDVRKDAASEFGGSYLPDQKSNLNSSEQNIFDEADHSSQFIAELPHKQNVWKVAARNFGEPYLPDQKSIDAVEKFWAQHKRKERYLSHIKGNTFIASFIAGIIDAKTCVGMLRSVATEYGYRSVYNIAKMAKETIIAAKEGRPSPNNSVSVDTRNLFCGDDRFADTAKKPDSLHPPLSVENSEIFRKNKDPMTRGVSLDWSETAAKIDAASCRKVAALTNLICAIIMPAYTLKEIIALTGKAELTVFRQHFAPANDAKKDEIDEMCVLACLQSLVQYFSKPSSTQHLFSAPLRLPPFDKHPIINLRGNKFFFPERKSENVVATMSVPAHSTHILNCRNERRGEKLVCQTTDGITAHILSPKPIKSKKKKLINKESNVKRDPFIFMKKKDRPLLMRNVLTLSGDYGRFSLMLGHSPSPDILFAENNYDALFPPSVIRKYRNKTLGATPFRNRHLDLRFWGVEITEAIGYTSCFRIRPSSLSEPSKKKKSNGNVVVGSKNPFVTRMGFPEWYGSQGLSDIFGEVNLHHHMAAFDHTIDKFAKLVEGEERWRVNQEEKVSVLKKCIILLVHRLKYLANRMEMEDERVERALNDNGEQARSLFSDSRCRQLCNNTEAAIMAAVSQQFGIGEKKRYRIIEPIADMKTAFKQATEAISVCRMLADECQKNPERFLDGECRVAAQHLYKYVYRTSARQYTQNGLIRGVKMSVLWRRPYDECADKAIAEVPRCRIPQLIVSVENAEEKRRMEGEEGVLLPELQIFHTRDLNPKPIRHILLSMMYGQQLAKDISAVNCLEWMDWCKKTAGEKLEEQQEELSFLIKQRSSGGENKKRRRDFISEAIHDESMPVYDILFPAASKSRKREIHKDMSFVWPPKKRTICHTRKRLHTTNKMRTGRLGYKDVYVIALTSLPLKLSNVVLNTAKHTGLKLP